MSAGSIPRSGTCAIALFVLPGVIASLAGELQATPVLNGPVHLQQAQRLVDEIMLQQSNGIFEDAQGNPTNRYGGSWKSATDPSYIQFADPVQGLLAENNTVCAPMITHMLQYCYAWNWKSFTFVDPLTASNKSSASPAPYQYIALMKQRKGFVQTPTNIGAIALGDIIAWWRPGSSSNDHAGIVAAIYFAAGRPYPVGHAQSNPLLVGCVLYPVLIVDSSSSTHTSDSRKVPIDGATVHIPGIGRGWIGLMVDAQGGIVGCTWSVPSADPAVNPTSFLNYVNPNLKWLGGSTPYEVVVGRLAIP
ncbi:MAG: hypothetical protein SFX72_22695 [Isosphaeraceae bacterium]|nr:hypothetical protein [Isosphaeraceae bacterium]